MAKQKKSHGKLCKAGRSLLITAVVLVMSGTVVFAADYVINHRNIFFFDTIRALAEAQRAELPPSAATYYEVPGSLEENQDLETPAELVSRYLENGRYDEETVLSDEANPPAGSLWEHRRVSTSTNGHYGIIRNEYLAGEAYAGKLVIEDLLEWDLAPVTEIMTPEEGGQILVTSRDTVNRKLVMADALLGYLTEDGERFQIYFSHDADSRLLQETEYVLNSAYDECYVHTTRDQVEVLIKAYDGQIWAQATNVKTGNEVHFYATGCTTAEMEAILDALALAIPLNAGA